MVVVSNDKLRRARGIRQQTGENQKKEEIEKSIEEKQKQERGKKRIVMKNQLLKSKDIS